MSTMNIERRIEDAMVTRLLARTYIAANSISVRRYDDRATADGNLIAVVACQPVERIEPNYSYYTTMLELAAHNNSDHDVEGNAVAYLYQDLLDEIMNDMTAASLSSSINNAAVIINGVVHQPGTYEGNERFKQHVCQANLFLTYEQPPQNTVLPVISGTTEVGETLTCSNGTWNNAVSYTRQWRRDGVNIGGATAATYLLAAADLGTDIDCVVTATNVATTTTATAVEVGPITSP